MLATIIQQQGLLTPNTQDFLKQDLSLQQWITEAGITPQAIAQACAQHFQLPYVDLDHYHHQQLPQNVLDDTFIKQHQILPIEQTSDQLTIAISEPKNLPALEHVHFKTQKTAQAVFVAHDRLNQLINHYLSSKHYTATQQHNAVDFIKQVITDAIHRDASDIHFEPYNNHYRIRLRLDGLLHTIANPDKKLASAFANRLKVLANMDLTEKRLPQDGRFQFQTYNHLQRDCRLSSCPTLQGEKLVLRLLNPQQSLLAIDQLGMTAAQQTQFLSAIKKPQGLILVCGPTGSGKTNTLYSALNVLNNEHHNIATIEDPIEIELPGINQTNIHRQAGLDFAVTLRALLRQDPDILMVGEIRDKETADMAIRAAQTGHLVLSTLHANSAAAAVTRLRNMGVAPFNIASALTLVIAQRLLRLNCTHCQHKNTCQYCHQGYLNRTGVFECLPITANITALIANNTNQQQLNQQAKQAGMQSLWQAAIEKVDQNLTTMTEIYRVIEEH